MWAQSWYVSITFRGEDHPVRVLRDEAPYQVSFSLRHPFPAARRVIIAYLRVQNVLWTER
jgi:hypothetical protein